MTALTKAEVLDRLRSESENQTTEYSYRSGLEWAASLVRKLPGDPQWQDEPTAEGWYWLKCASERYGYIADAQAPVWIYKSRDNGLWYISDPDTVYDERLDGMQVAPCTGRPAE